MPPKDHSLTSSFVGGGQQWRMGLPVRVKYSGAVVKYVPGAATVAVKAWQVPCTSWQIGAMASLQRVSHPQRLNKDFKIRSLRTTDYSNTRRGPGSRFSAHAHWQVAFVVHRLLARYGE